MRVNLRAISERASHDPRQTLLDSAGPLTDYEVFHNLVLVATYVPPPKIMKNALGEDVQFHMTDRSLQEDRFQGKVALVLKVGPLAFQDDDVAKFGGVTVEPGDWIIYRPSDADEMFIKDWKGQNNDGLSVRLIADGLIKGRVTKPELIY